MTVWSCPSHAGSNSVTPSGDTLTSAEVIVTWSVNRNSSARSYQVACTPLLITSMPYTTCHRPSPIGSAEISDLVCVG